MSTTQQWQGPLPPPGALAQFDQIVEGGAERIFAMVARNKPPDLKGKTQFQRFVETAKALEVDESGKAFERAMKVIAPPKSGTSPGKVLPPRPSGSKSEA